jgi:adenylate cyclase
VATDLDPYVKEFGSLRRSATIAAMLCPACDVANRDDATFCARCGSPIGRRCDSCGRAIAAAARYCDGCGRSVSSAHVPPPDPSGSASDYTPRHLREGVLASPSTREGERKQVTVLFVDVKGSVGLSARVDSEDWHDIMERFFAIAGDAVHRFGGTLNQYTGDGIMALFGAPTAYEDHARRAGLAALALRDALVDYRLEVGRERGLDLVARMGLHSGEVVVGSIGVDLRRDYTATGYTTGLAARVQVVASPGEIFATEQTVERARGFFELEPKGTFELAGALAPVRLYRLVGATRKRSVTLNRATAAFVGRRAELARLEDAFQTALAGTGRTLGVVGEAGLGKTRLCAEFLARCRDREVAVYETHCAAHGAGRPYLPIVELVRAVLGVGIDDPPDTARAQVGRRLAELGPGLTGLLPIALDFLELHDPAEPALPLDPDARQRLLLALLQALVDHASAAGPAIVLIDDVHWIDESSARLLARLIETAETRPLLVLLTLRPGFHSGWMSRAGYEQIALAPLSAGPARELIAELLGPEASRGSLSDWILQRSAGNALFVEETVATLTSAGVLVGERGGYRQERAPEGVEIPPTVQALLASRVDRLSEAEKRVLQAAAVIGRQLQPEVLTEVVGLDAETLARALESLHRAELLSVESFYPLPRYAFRHPLIREVTYRAQLRDRRKRLHAAVAQHLALAHGRPIGAHSESIAFHFEQAGDALEAARWLRRFCGWLAGRDLKQSVASARRVRDLLERVPESPEVLHLRLSARRLLVSVGYQVGMSSEELEATLREAHDLAERGAPAPERELAILYSSHGQAHLHRGEVAGAIAATERAMDFANRAGDRELEYSLTSYVVFLLRSTGRLRQALDVASEALAVARQHPDWGLRYVGHHVGTLLLHRQGALLCDTGNVVAGLDAMERAATRARASDDQQILCWQLHDRIWLAELVGPIQGLAELAEEALEIAERRGSDSMLTQALGAQGAAWHVAGRFEKAITAWERALTVSRERNAARIYEPQCLAALAEAHLAVGDPDAAERRLAGALESAGRLGSAPQEIRAQIARARLRLAGRAADRADAAAALDRADALAEEIGGSAWRPVLSELRAACAAAAGDSAGRDARLREAALRWCEMGDPERAARASPEPIRALDA